MPTKPTQARSRKVSVHKPLHIVLHNPDQHGPLFHIPPESLTHITSYLPPSSLFALALTCRCLCDHVDDDNTWLRAFLTQLLGIGPEHELESEHAMLLKRTQQTWRKEFIFRYTNIQRWQRSRSPTVTHMPLYSSIDGVHLISEHGLLTSSIQYGIVARSIPLNGRVLRGYIDAAGTGLGIGNPNVEFTPNVSACTIALDNGTARVFWGMRNGEIGLTVVNRVMDPRAASTFIRSDVSEEHQGVVQQIISDSDSNTCFSAGADGCIKLWDAGTLRLLWSTDKQQVSLVADPFVCIAGSLSNGFIVGALKSGDILLCDLHESETTTGQRRVCSVHQLRISSPLEKPRTNSRSDELPQQQQIAKIWLYRTRGSAALLLIQYTHHPQMHRIHADVVSHDVTITALGSSTFSNVSTVEPVMSDFPSGNSMVIAGDLLGYVSMYDASLASQHAVAPVHRFEAHTDGPVTAISWSPTVFATGSARGTTVVWDSLTLEPVRYFTTPAPRPAPGDEWEGVTRILLNQDLVIIVVGNRVLTWKVTQTDGHAHFKKTKHANGKINVATKGHKQYEMHNDIAESFLELEYERTYMQRLYGREREQRSTLDTLGLSEREAVEYVLMLSRDEEEARQERAVADEGVFEGDFDDPSGRSMSSSPPGPTTLYPSSSNYRSNDRTYPRIALPTSNEKVQVSPPFVPEPMEAGTSISPLRSSAMGISARSGPMEIRSTSSSSSDFPSLSSSLSSTSSLKQGTSTSASPGQSRSAWSTPLKATLSLHGSSPPRRAVAPVIAQTRSSNSSLSSANIAQHKETATPAKMSGNEEMDDDLKLAIELSLAEARSRGEAV